MHLFVHICCGPCAVYPMTRLAAAGHSLTGFFYNPNIHPWQEFHRRLETAEELSRIQGWPLIIDDHYGMREYLRRVVFDEENRCSHCYEMRFERIAAEAKRGGYDAFTSTLLYSKYQKHELIRKCAAFWAEKYRVEFYYKDFREGWQEGIDESIRLGLYRQPYCGCIYSEQERYDKHWRNKRKSRQDSEKSSLYAVPRVQKQEIG